MKVSSRSSKVATLIAERQTFETYGALKAEWNGGYPSGRLPSPWREQFDADTRHPDGRVGVLAYVVYSYATPIAWWTESNGWVVPDVKYSPTTSKHQGKLYLVRSLVRTA